MFRAPPTDADRPTLSRKSFDQAWHAAATGAVIWPPLPMNDARVKPEQVAASFVHVRAVGASPATLIEYGSPTAGGPPGFGAITNALISSCGARGAPAPAVSGFVRSGTAVVLRFAVGSGGRVIRTSPRWPP